MTLGDLHSALKTAVLADLNIGGIHYKYVRLQQAKDRFVETLHARPTSHSSAGIQSTDILHLLGFRRATCAFNQSECYCREMGPGHDPAEIARVVSSSIPKFTEGAGALESCGIYVARPEGWGFFYGKPSDGRSFAVYRPAGDGHVAPKTQRLKESEDNFFRFVFTWIEGAGDKGWTTHYRAKHMPLSPEFQAALDFLQGFYWFRECPEFDFEGCWWRFMPFRPDPRDVFNQSAETAHGHFDAHVGQFSRGLAQLLEAHSLLAPFGLSFLSIREPASLEASRGGMASRETAPAAGQTARRGHRYDVAISYAGTERSYAEELAKRVRDAGFQVFYDGFYPEQLWGKDLAAFFDAVYRKDSRFCVMLVSQEYADRMWTTHERRSAQARAIEEKGREYILPVRVDQTDLPGLPPTIGYLALKDYSIEQIATLLVNKLKSAT